MIIGKNASQHFIKRIIGIHFFSVLLLTIVVLLHLFKPLQQIKTSIVLIWFFTGVACSGIVWRSTYNYFIKSYFLLFAASFFLFVSIPSKLFSIIVYGSWQVKNYNRFLLYDNLFLDKQSSLLQGSDTNSYKIVKKMGYFNKTLIRDISIGYNIDSVFLYRKSNTDSIHIRAFYTVSNAVQYHDMDLSLKQKPAANTISRGKGK